MDEKLTEEQEKQLAADGLARVDIDVLEAILECLSGVEIVKIWMSGCVAIQVRMAQGAVKRFAVEEWKREPNRDAQEFALSKVMRYRAHRGILAVPSCCLPKWPTILTNFLKLEDLEISYSRYMAQAPRVVLAGLTRCLRSLLIPNLPADFSLRDAFPTLHTLVVDNVGDLDPTWPQTLPSTTTRLELSNIACPKEAVFCALLPADIQTLRLVFTGPRDCAYHGNLQLPPALVRAHISFSNRATVQAISALPQSLRVSDIACLELNFPLPLVLDSLFVSSMEPLVYENFKMLPPSLQTLDLGANAVVFTQTLAAVLPRALTTLSGRFASIPTNALRFLPQTLRHLDIHVRINERSRIDSMKLPRRLETLRCEAFVPRLLSYLPPTLTALHAPLENAHALRGEILPTLRKWSGLQCPYEWTYPEVQLSRLLDTLDATLINPRTIACLPAQITALTMDVLLPAGPWNHPWSWHFTQLRACALTAPASLFSSVWARSLPLTLEILHLEIQGDLIFEQGISPLDDLPDSLVELNINLLAAVSLDTFIATPIFVPETPYSASSGNPSSDSATSSSDRDSSSESRLDDTPTIQDSSASEAPILTSDDSPFSEASMGSFLLGSPPNRSHHRHSQQNHGQTEPQASPSNGMPASAGFEDEDASASGSTSLHDSHSQIKDDNFSSTYIYGSQPTSSAPLAVRLWPLQSYPPRLECLVIRTGLLARESLIVSLPDVSNLPTTLQSLELPPLVGAELPSVEAFLNFLESTGLTLLRIPANSFQ